MSTRASVWLRKPSTGEEAYLYHHCDGYALDDDLDRVLKELPMGTPWNMEKVFDAIVDYDDAYGRHRVSSIGWDSEYVYVIDLDERTLKKYGCGICSKDELSIEQEKTQDKYLERIIKYPSLSENEVNEKINSFVLALKAIINNTAKLADVNGAMKKEAVKRLYELYNADKGL